MKQILSFLERYSFVKIFSSILIATIFLTGVTHAQEQDLGVVTNPLSSENYITTKINLFPPKPITLIYGNKETTLLTYEKSIVEFLNQHNIEYSENDIIWPELNTEIKDTNFIRITLVEKKLRIEIEEIPFTIESFVDNEIPYGEQIAEQIGSVGQLEVEYMDIYQNGGHIRTERLKEAVLIPPVNTNLRVGAQTTALGGSNCAHWFNTINEVTEDEQEREILKSLITCESKCNDAKNNNNIYLGLLQFNTKTFNHYGGTDIWDGTQQIVTALSILRAGGLSHHWPACSRNIN